MFIYEKKLQYPVKIANCNPKLASFHHQSVRRAGRRVGRLPALFEPALFHALP